jgi:hypothetical protein
MSRCWPTAVRLVANPFKTFRLTRGVGNPTVNFIAPERKKERKKDYCSGPSSSALRDEVRGKRGWNKKSLSDVHNYYAPWKYLALAASAEKSRRLTAYALWHGQDLPEGNYIPAW